MDRNYLDGATPGWRKRGVALAVAGTCALLAGCLGGGGGDNAGGTGTSPVGVKVIDGAIRNALVCVDSNGNGACDAGEVSGRTDASGNVTLQVPAGEAGKSPILAIVDTDAVDADHGPVTTRYVMKAPADQPAVVSPLTTLVQTAVEQSGVTSAQAAGTVQSSLGLNVSLFQDYTQGTTTDNVVAGTVARMVVVATQQQAAAVDAAEGTKAVDGSTITQADLDKLVAQKLLELMPRLAEALATPAVQAAITQAVQDRSLAGVDSAVTTQATSIVTTSGVTAGAASTLVAINNQQATTQAAPAPTAGVQLTSFSFSDVANWTRFLNVTSAAGAVPDANGFLHYTQNIARSTSGVVANWSSGADPSRQSDLHWNGSSWVACALDQTNLSKPYDAQGRTTYNTCDKFATGTSTRATFDVAGQKLADVYNTIRSAGYTNLFINNAATALGSAIFPANAKLFYQTVTPAETAPAYQRQTSTILRVYNSAGLVAGEATACGAVTSTTPTASYTVEATTLEAAIAAVRGTACVYPQETFTNGSGVTLTSGPRNEAFGFPSINVGTLGTAPLAASRAAATTFFTTNQLLRAAFGPDNTATYYSCRQRWDGSARNCDSIGTGTYTITTLGDARVLTFNNAPVQFASLNYERVLVEREGKVHVGFRNRSVVTNNARFNLEAMNALFTQLGLPLASTAMTVAPTTASYQGDWLLWDTTQGASGYLGDTTLVRIPAGFNGSSGAQCFSSLTGAPVGAAYTPCTVTVDASTGVLNLADSTGTGTVTLDVVTGLGSGTGTDSGVPLTVSARRR